jgi:opacity protein-like surface antigen
MKRLVLALLSAGALSAPALAADCAKQYKDFWTNIDREAFARLSPEQMVDLNRTTLRVYDGCTSGDERFTAGNFFQQLDASRYSKASDIFSSGAFAPPGAKK